MLYSCSRYPVCDANVRTHLGTTIPVGEMANGHLRALRRTDHRYFGQLHQSGFMSKKEAYRWLAATISAPMSQTHTSPGVKHFWRRGEPVSGTERR